MTAKQLANKIAKQGTSVPRHVDQGADFGRRLDRELRALGFADAKVYSRCTKASFESHLEKSGVRVDITSAVLFGPFTQVEVRR